MLLITGNETPTGKLSLSLSDEEEEEEVKKEVKNKIDGRVSEEDKGG